MGGTPHPALLALYSWRDGAEGAGPFGELIDTARFLSLEEAISNREFDLRVAHEIEAPPEVPAAMIFDPGWFPILQDASGRVYVVEDLGRGRVLLVDQQDPGNPEELSNSLIEFLDRIARDGMNFKPPPLSADVAVLVGRLESDEGRERWNAVRELTRKRPPAAFEPLLAILDSPDEQARIDAALLLGALGDSRAVAPLIRCAAVWTGKDVTSALAGLAAIGDEGAFGHLEGALAKGDPEMRMDGVKALAATRDARAVPALQMAAAGDADPSVRAAATDALRQLGEPR
jgi:HEAT repeat protein